MMTLNKIFLMIIGIVKDMVYSVEVFFWFVICWSYFIGSYVSETCSYYGYCIFRLYNRNAFAIDI